MVVNDEQLRYMRGPEKGALMNAGEPPVVFGWCRGSGPPGSAAGDCSQSADVAARRLAETGCTSHKLARGESTYFN